ncbi:MAG: sugar ABC transporter permease [Clostridia bacterium]|nr:sugar ABC transporter permease [Clostridia bacterium]
MSQLTAVNKGRVNKRLVTDLLFITPTVLAFLLVIIIPFIYGIYYSFTDWNGVATTLNFIGLQNYANIFNDVQFVHSFLMTVEFTAINIVFVNVVAFILAMLVTSKARARNIYRAGFFVPNLIGGIVLGTIWQFIFNNIIPNLGQTLGWTALSRSLISQQSTVIWMMSVVNTWQYAGYIMMIFVASIQGISQSVLEAAETDGASYMLRIRKIIIPLMANAFTISLFLTLTNSFKMFDVNVALTNGGPAGVYMRKAINVSELLALNIYNTAYKFSKMAEGQARAVVFFLILVIVSLIQVNVNKRKEVEM